MTEGLVPRQCFVGMFDIIGFKALRASRGTAGLHQQFSRGILPAIQHSAAGKGKTAVVNGQKVYVPDFNGSKVKFKAISDTVIFYTETDSFEDFIHIVASSFMLLKFGFNGGKAPYRGAIGWGDLIDDPSGILIGSALEDAYAGEASQAWAGAMLTEACRDFLIKSGYIENFKSVHLNILQQVDESKREGVKLNSLRLVKYRVPTQINPKDGAVKYGALDTFAIDWTIQMYEGASAKSFESTDNSHAQVIAKNTEEFENWARVHNR